MAKAFDVKMHMAGFVDMGKVMQGIDLSKQKRVFEMVMAKATQPTIAAAKATLAAKGSVRTGALMKSIAGVVRTYKSGRVVGLVGAQKTHFGAKLKKGKWRLRKTKAGALKDGEERIVPANYIHLVELGHRNAAGDKTATFQKGHKSLMKGKTFRKGTAQLAAKSTHTAPKAFLRPAYEATKGQVAGSINKAFTEALAVETKRAIKSLAKKIVKSRSLA